MSYFFAWLKIVHYWCEKASNRLSESQELSRPVSVDNEFSSILADNEKCEKNDNR